MKKTFIMIALAGLSFSCQNQEVKEEKTVEKVVETKMISQEKVLRHVVLFKFKDETAAADIQKVVDSFLALPSKIDVIQDVEWGTNNSPEGLSQGFTHCFFLTFLSEADRDVYLPHPDHKEFGAVLGPHLDKVLVVDYWTEE